MKYETPKAVIAFFGIDRRLDITAPTIIEKIIEPAKQYFEVTLAAHLWAIDSINNPRSREHGDVSTPRLSLLPEGDYYIEEPPCPQTQADYKRLRNYGDFWGDNFSSLSNLYAQLISLKQVTQLAMQHQPEYVIFVRPDLLYHDSLAAPLQEAAKSDGTGIWLPHWQPHGGLNDRFAICRGEAAIRAYGQRIDGAIDFCKASHKPLHAEKLLQFSLRSITVYKIANRASRVRIDGRIKTEDFSLHGWKSALREKLGSIKRMLQK
jgi:hypothetical protein